MNSLFKYWKDKVFRRRDWGLRKYDYMKQDIKMKYELINEKLKDKSFNQVR